MRDVFVMPDPIAYLEKTKATGPSEQRARPGGGSCPETRVRPRAWTASRESVATWGHDHQSMNEPPFTATASPVMNAASGPSRKATTLATSSGVSRRRRGVSAI